jgi:long-chain acyl-CoA synthetase
MSSSFSKSSIRYTALVGGAVVVTYAGTKAYKSYIEQKDDDTMYLKNQTIEIDPVEHIRRGTHYKDIDIYSYYKIIYPHIKSLGDIFYQGYSVSNNGPCLTTVDLSNKTSPFNWISYSIALERIRFIGSHFWTEVKLTPMKSKVAILSLNRPEYTFVEHGCYMYGFIVIGLYTNYDSQTILSLLEKTQTEVLVVDNFDRIKSFKNQLFDNLELKQILVMDPIKSEDENEKIRTIPMILKTMQQSNVRPLPKIDPDSIATFILTSGTTGQKRER